MNDFMDTIDPRIERGVPHRQRPVHMPTYYVRWGVRLTIAIAALAVIVIVA